MKQNLKDLASIVRNDNMNLSLERALFDSVRNGLDIIDFHETVHEKDYPEIAIFLREHKISEVTVTSTWSGIVPFLVYLVNDGWQVTDGVPVKTGINWDDTPRLEMGLKLYNYRNE